MQKLKNFFFDFFNDHPVVILFFVFLQPDVGWWSQHGSGAGLVDRQIGGSTPSANAEQGASLFGEAPLFNLNVLSGLHVFCFDDPPWFD
jgi:hypothetical protein